VDLVSLVLFIKSMRLPAVLLLALSCFVPGLGDLI